MRDTSPSSLKKALSLLDVFTPENSVLSVRELAKRAEIPRSTTHRLVSDLVEWGALEQDSSGVRLGVKLFELGAMTPSYSSLRETVSPFLHTLNEVTGLTANLGILEDAAIVYLDKISIRSMKVPHSRLGGRGAAHATGLGKAILAFSPEDKVELIISRGLRAVTPKSIIEPDILREQLRTIHRNRVAFDLEESQLGLFCVAAPILDYRGKALAAISVTGATKQSEAERFAPTVIALAQAVSRVLASARMESIAHTR